VKPEANEWKRFAGFAVIAAACTAAYWPALFGGFIWDDDGHVTRPELRSLHGLWRIWTEPGATQQYYPVLHTTFWLEHRAWGDAALAYHVANLGLHLAACLLLYRLLRVLAVPGAVFGAAAFALHPVCAETVAWISEEKNTLSAVFALGAVLAYLRFETGGRRGWYAGATLLFVLALLSKSVTATVPAAILVLLWWKRGRLGMRDAAWLLPWFCASAAAAVVTPWVESRFVGASAAAFPLGAMSRVLVAGRALWFYASKILWPSNLVFIYPRWSIDPAAAWQYLFPAGAAAAIAAAFVAARRTRGPLAALLLYAGILFPALGFINVYPFVFSYVADHFQYLGAAAFIPAVCAALALGAARPPALARLSPAIAVAVLAVLAALTRRQSAGYRDVETFYETILSRNPDAWLAHDNLGVVLVKKGRIDEASAHYREAIRLNPSYPEAYNNLGNALAQRGRYAEAADAYEGALRARPSFVAAEINWGNAMNDAGRYREAELHFRKVLAAGRGDPAVHYGLANALANSGRLDEAIAEYRETVRLEPGSPEAHANLGLAYAMQRRWPEALAETQEATRLRPSYAEAHAYEGLALAGAGRTAEAVSEYRRSLEINPANPDVHYQLAVALRALGRTDEARQEFMASQAAH
jgi:tetratricopeptide (TPR) repeat protein